MEAIGVKTLSAVTPLIRSSIQPSKRICKSLFGPVDHDEIKSQLDAELVKDLNEKSQEWCFNFAEDTPIRGGSLEWEKVKEEKVENIVETPKAIINEDRRVPELHPERNDPENNVFLAPTELETAKAISTRCTSAATSTNDSVKKRAEPVAERKRKRPCKTITDFMKQKKKRRVSVSSQEKNSKVDLSPNGRCVKDDLALRNSAKKVRLSEG